MTEKAKQAIYSKSWRERNPDKRKAYEQKYYASPHGKKIKLDCQKRAYLRNRESILQKLREKRQTNRETYNASMQEWRRKNPDRVKHYRRKRVFGLSKQQFLELLKACKNKCQVCGTPFTHSKGRWKSPYVDHCHKTGMIRGLLCGSCNGAEGFLKTPENARRLYEYMLKNSLFYQGNS